ncbi:putative delta-60 repeat protein [Prosthecobacter fusiformis]|uniref:Putative delta-60 repeat protein n=2 Tax=Prosthecobacter fusiformis TaxID=48464 RepID=A0A4R7RJX7_9BACT|nr:putative delta-60 repeat protein [Prosthecobacter fusiformis]
MINASIARLNADGTTDMSFNTGEGLNGPGLCVMRTAAGKVLVEGEFTEVNGEVCGNLAVLDETGELEETGLVANGAVKWLLGQTDGKVLAGGGFTLLGGVERQRLVRLKDDLTVEAAFTPAANGTVNAGALLGDGRVMVAGAFTEVGGVARGRVARMFNDEASTRLRVEDEGRVTWLRGGAGAETVRVSLEVDTGTGYGPLGGTVVRVPGGWQVTGLELDGSGSVRARAFPSDGHSEGVVEEVVAFDFVPVMQVREGERVLGDGDEVDWGTMQTGMVVERTFVISNLGLSEMELGSPPVVVPEGPWTVVEQPGSPVAAGESVTFVVRFQPTEPTESGGAAVEMSLTSDADESPLTVELRGRATAGPGSVDEGFQVVLTGGTGGTAVNAVSLSAAGLMLGGAFATVNGLNRKGFARMSAVGTVLAQTGVGVNATVHAVAELPDGKWLVGGTFTTVHGVTRQRLARLNADGSLDAGFKMNANNTVHCLLVQEDGGVIVGGAFTTLAGVARKGVGRVTAGGLLDVGWKPGTEGAVMCLATQPDGKIYAGGLFGSMGGAVRRDLARLNVDGSLDGEFNAGLTGSAAVLTLAVDAAGRVLFSRAGVSGLMRVTETGGEEEAVVFTPADRMTYALTLQADGKILAGGEGTGPLLLRMDATGANDGSFINTMSHGQVRQVALSASGELYAAGTEMRAGGLRYLLARFYNGPEAAVSVLTVVSETEVQWQRGGTVPEAQGVVFDLSEDEGATWTRLGRGTRMSGGWRLTGLNLPIRGRMRGRAAVVTGGKSAAFHDEVVSFSGLPVADLRLEHPVGTVLGDGAVLPFPGTLPGQHAVLTVTMRNVGNAVLTGLLPTSETAEWTVTSVGRTSLEAGQSTTMAVRFLPTATGYRTGRLSLTSDVPGTKNPYVLELRGTGIALPTATTSTAAPVLSYTAQLKGTVKANHDVAKAFFEYKRRVDAVWIRTAEVTVAGFAAVAQAVTLGDLALGTGYHYRMGIYNSVNTAAAPVYGTTVNFNTLNIVLP